MQRYRGNGDTWLLASLNYLGFEFGTMASAPWHGRNCIQIHNGHVPSYYVDTMFYKSGARFKMTLPGAYKFVAYRMTDLHGETMQKNGDRSGRRIDIAVFVFLLA